MDRAQECLDTTAETVNSIQLQNFKSLLGEEELISLSQRDEKGGPY